MATSSQVKSGLDDISASIRAERQATFWTFGAWVAGAGGGGNRLVRGSLFNSRLIGGRLAA